MLATVNTKDKEAERKKRQPRGAHLLTIMNIRDFNSFAKRACSSTAPVAHELPRAGPVLGGKARAARCGAATAGVCRQMLLAGCEVEQRGTAVGVHV